MQWVTCMYRGCEQVKQNLNVNAKISFSTQGPSINDVTARQGRGYQGFCDNSTKALLLKSVTMGEGYKKLSKTA
jgi:hypothetical protein